MIGDSGNAYVVALVILAMVLVAVVGYHWLPKADVQLAVGNCRLDQQTACAADLPGGGRIEVAVAPRPVATSQAFEFRADLAGIRPNSVEVAFTGVEMNMGVTRLPLEAQGEGRYAGRITLPVCVTGGMLWQATVLIDADRRLLSVPFRFESRHG
ncbi:MAG: hypothetical protein IPO57_15375 [Rhodocyclales bacterium]|jgi:hypothetical protein|nr:hypothetical protein [Rhodocyclales bacterium]